MTQNKKLENAIKNQKRKNRENKKTGKAPQVYNLLKDYSEGINWPPKGKPTGICSKCGKEFEQDFSKDRNAYSSFPSCPECRAKLAKKKEEKLLNEGSDENTIIKKLPYEPYPWQVEAEEAFRSHRFVVLACGNRSGYNALCIE